MSNTRFLELDSTYRDRNRWPLPAQFEIPISQTGQKGRFDAIDPVSYAAPVKSWTSNNFNLSTPGVTFVTATVDTIGAPNNVAATNGTQVFVITAAAGLLQQITNYYISAIANNTSISQLRRIFEYRYLGTDSGGTNDRALLTVESSYSDAFAPGNTIVITDPTDISNTSFPLFFIPFGDIGTNVYTTYLLYNETLNESRPISYYDFSTHLLQVNTSTSVVATQHSGLVTGWLITDNYSIRKEKPALFGTILAGATTTSIPLSAVGISNTTDFYNRQFLRITSGADKNEIQSIISYDGLTNTARVLPGFTTAPALNDTFEILNFSYDNAVPFVYTGSMVSQQEEVCYEITLIDLVLPNKMLISPRGGRIAFYPYVYVELVNISGANSGMKNIIYSNNPNATKMLFRATVNDITNPIVSTFVKINGDGATQTVKFKPNDSLRFSVRLQNGEIYQTNISDYYSPYVPNFDVQISALFGLKRL